MAFIPGSLETQTRTPLDGKYWVNDSQITTLNAGLTFNGLQRFDKTNDKLWIKLSTGWKELLTTVNTPTYNLTIGSVSKGTNASATITGTSLNPILNLVLPKGDIGITPIIDIGQVTSGSTPSVTNVGTPDRAILDFVLPQGGVGDVTKEYVDAADGILQDNIDNLIIPLPTSRVFWVQGGGQSGYIRDGSKNRPFLNVPEALSYAVNGDIIYVLPGGDTTDYLGRRAYSNVTIVVNNVTIVSYPDVVYTGVWNIGGYQGFTPHNIRIIGGEWSNGHLDFMKQGNGASTSTITGASFTNQGYFLYYGNGSANAYSLDICTLRNCFFNTNHSVGGQEPLQSYGRDDGYTQGNVIVDSCLIISQHTSGIRFVSHPDSKVILKGNTEIRSTTYPELISLINAPSGNITPISTWLIDERLTSAQNLIKRIDVATSSSNGVDISVVNNLLVLSVNGSTTPTQPAAPTDLAVDSSRNASFTPASGKTATDYEIEII